LPSETSFCCERKPFPKDLKRVEQRITPSATCADCGGRFKELGADVMEELKYVPGHYIVNQIIRPRLACICCEAVVQAEMPSRPIPKSFVGPALMAHSTSPPAAWYQFSTNRKAQHPSQHLQTYKGFAHADAYAGYNDVYRTGRVTEMACMAHTLNSR
jgi:hypothetical protein